MKKEFQKIRCQTGMDILSVQLGLDLYLSRYRYFKAMYSQLGIFDADYSVLIKSLPKKDFQKLLQLSHKLPLVKFTKTRIQFLNETKVLKSLIREKLPLSYNQKIYLHSNSYEYEIDLNDNCAPKIQSDWKNNIWTLIAVSSFKGMSQAKIASRIGRRREFINRKFKEAFRLKISNRSLELASFPKGLRSNKEIFNKVKNSKFGKGLKFKTFTYRKKGILLKQVKLIKVLPNEYNLKNNYNIKNEAKTFRFTSHLINSKRQKKPNGFPISDDKKKLLGALKKSNRKTKSALKLYNECFGIMESKIKIKTKKGVEKEMIIRGETLIKPYDLLKHQILGLKKETQLLSLIDPRYVFISRRFK